MQAVGLILLFFKKLKSTISFEHCHEKYFFSLHVFSRDLKQCPFKHIQKYQHALKPVCVKKLSKRRNGEAK